jgi:Mg-chelatase subunit ChlD
MEHALLKVERRGFAATLAVSKWLMQQFVTEIAEPRRAPQNPQTQSLAAQALQRLKNRPATPETTPPPPDRTGAPDAGTRTRAFEKLLEVMGCPSALYSWRDDVTPDKRVTKEEKDRGRAAAEFVQGLDTRDETKLEEFLTASESKMAEVVTRALKTLGQQMGHDGWVTKNAFGKVNLRTARARKENTPQPEEDRNTARRLKAFFYRVLGRRRFTLHETGSEIDVAAYIESVVSQQPAPCFRTEESGRGFKVLVLVDRSGSMLGEKTKQAERACRTLEASLKFPFVDFYVWGFQSFKMGEIDITRFKPGALNLVSDEVEVAGATPLHLALRVAVRFMEEGSEAKQIIVITDGAPTHATRTGNRFATKTLMTYAREEIRHARRQGMNVTGVVIGQEMKDAHLSFMLGPPANWRRMETERLGEGLIRVVSSSFEKYLRNG